MSCKNCSSAYDRCPDVLTSNCVTFQGKPISCLDICTGDSITDVETTIANNVCNLNVITDVSAIISGCINLGIKPKTIFNYLQAIIDFECALSTTITQGLSGKIGYTDQFTLDYPSCCNTGCFSDITLTIPAHLQKIINCLCAVSTYVGYGDSDTITNLTTEIINLKSDVAALTLQLDRISCINAQLISILGPSGYVSCP